MPTKSARVSKQARTRPHAQQPKKKFPVLPVVFGALAALLVAAMLFTGGGGSQSDEDRIAVAAGTPEVTGPGLAPFITGGGDPATGAVAPTVTGSGFDGESVSISHNGTPKAILFLAHWCSHCQAEVPLVQQWLDTTGGVAGVDVISVTTAYQPERGNWSPQDWLDTENWTVPVIRDDAESSVYTAYGAGGFPYWVFLNGDGAVAGRASGRMPIAQLESLLGALVDA